jgi:hypothetical protein
VCVGRQFFVSCSGCDFQGDFSLLLLDLPQKHKNGLFVTLKFILAKCIDRQTASKRKLQESREEFHKKGETITKHYAK